MLWWGRCGECCGGTDVVNVAVGRCGKCCGGAGVVNDVKNVVVGQVW